VTRQQIEIQIAEFIEENSYINENQALDMAELLWEKLEALGVRLPVERCQCGGVR
jgi:hypothetical protein